MASLRSQVEWARYQERQRQLDEQAERQRQRAPEPEIETYEPPGLSEFDIKLAAGFAMIPLVILGTVWSWWAFWIGAMLVAVALTVAAR